MQLTAGSDNVILLSGPWSGLTTPVPGGNVALPLDWAPSLYEYDSDRVRPTGRGQSVSPDDEAAWSLLAARARAAWASENPY